ncbi:MAG: hypothetical protein ACRD94_04200 [Nitrosopumilaceae archaeon]
MEELSHLANRYVVTRKCMDLRGFFTISFSGVAALLFVLGFVIPFFWFSGDPMILLAGYGSLAIIVIIFVLNVKKGSHIVGLIMIPMGGYAIFFGYNSLRIWSAELATNANDPDFMSNFSGQDDFAVSVIITGSVLLGMGLFSIIRRLNRIKKIERKTAI